MIIPAQFVGVDDMRAFLFCLTKYQTQKNMYFDKKKLIF